MADSAQDPLANLYNAAALPYMFGPNKYSDYNDKPLPLPGFRGAPTDAHGNPIQSFTDAQQQHDAWNAANPSTPGTTLNSTPAGQTFGLQPSDLAKPSALNPSGNLAFGMGEWGGMMSPQARELYANSQYQQPGGGYTNPGLVTTAANPQQATGAAGAGAAAQTNPIDMRQAYLDALSNPGHVTTPGANVPESTPPAQQPNVLQSFLANNQGSTGAGGYSNMPFFNTLKGLRAGAG